MPRWMLPQDYRNDTKAPYQQRNGSPTFRLQQLRMWPSWQVRLYDWYLPMFRRFHWAYLWPVHVFDLESILEC